MTALEISGIGKTYGHRRVLDDVSFTVPRGSVYGLLGPNGAGKTTLFSIAAGFVRPDGGTVRALGQDIRDLRPLYGRIGILPQDALFQANLPIADQLAFYLELCGRPRARAAAEVARALERVGLSDYLASRPTALSHGMQKRLGLAQAFLGEPDLILLDEPTAGLDPANAGRIRALIGEFRDRRATIVISSHDLAEMQALCDHVCILRQGRVVSAGRVDDIAKPAQRFALALSRALSADEVAACARLPEVQSFTASGRAGYDLAVLATDDNQRGAAAVGRVLTHLIASDAVPYQLIPGNRLEQHFLEVTAPPAGSAPDRR